MIYAAFSTATGEIAFYADVEPPEVEGMSSLEVGVTPAVPFYVVDGALTARPSLVLPVSPQASPATITLADYPIGTWVEVRNEIGETVETADPAETIELATPGTYRIRFEPPFPHLPASMFMVTT